jgi:cyclophilin family peptidyl-prolyl cis-trans isomerase
MAFQSMLHGPEMYSRPKEYTVFGEVVKGMDVIMKINDVKVNRLYRPTEDVRIIKAKVLK